MSDERLLPPGMEAERRCCCGKFIYKGRWIDGPAVGEHHSFFSAWR